MSPVSAPTRQVALLRGINVGRSQRVPMARLRELLTSLGYTDVVTHLQSGNAVFTADEPPASTADAIERGLRRVLEVNARVIVRTHAELTAAAGADPLAAVATDPARHLLGFLSDTPDPGRVESTVELGGDAGAGPDQVRIIGRHLYLWCPRGVLESVFASVDWDRRLGVATTMRNWNTVTRLVELTGEQVGQRPPWQRRSGGGAAAGC